MKVALAVIVGLGIIAVSLGFTQQSSKHQVPAPIIKGPNYNEVTVPAKSAPIAHQNNYAAEQIRRSNIPDGTIVNVLGIGPYFHGADGNSPLLITFSESLVDFDRNEKSFGEGKVFCIPYPSSFYSAMADYGHNSVLLLHGRLKRLDGGKIISIENCRLIDPEIN